MKREHITVNNKRIYLRSAGSGTPVMLLHGFAEDGEIWRNHWDAIAEKHQVLVPDLPGSGQSAAIEDMSMEGMADYMHELLQATLPNQSSGKSIIVIGHSMGGYITLAFAEKYPAVLKGFGLFHSTAYPDSAEKKEARRKSIAFIESHGSAPFIRQSIPNLFADPFRTNHAAAVEEMIVRYSDFDPVSLVAYYEVMIARPSRTGVLKNAGCPVLFIAGKQDKAVSYADILEQCHLPAVSELCILESAGHMGMFEETDKCRQALLDFLTTVTLPAIT